MVLEFPLEVSLVEIIDMVGATSGVVVDELVVLDVKTDGEGKGDSVSAPEVGAEFGAVVGAPDVGAEVG
jgi:hypothetical protein